MVSRRDFFGSVMAAGAVGIPAADALAATEGKALVEPSRTVKVAGQADVIVTGGGPAGIAAAVGAARQGAKVILLESRGMVGGVWTNGLLGCLLGFNYSEFDREILSGLGKFRARSPRNPRLAENHGFLYEPAYMRFVCERLLAEAGVRIRLGTSVVSAVRDPAGRNLRAVITESKSGREAWLAGKFVDCTGDGDLAALAGCGFDVGGANGKSDEQPASLIGMFALPETDDIRRFIANDPANFDAAGEQTVDAKAELKKELTRLGVAPSYGAPTLFRIGRGLFILMANHEYGVSVDDADAISEASLRANREVVGMAEALAGASASGAGSPWRGLRLVATADQICHRRARRIHGRYRMKVEDCFEGATFDDAVATCSFGIDVHAVSKQMDGVLPAGSPFKRQSRPYQIPFRACQAADLDNLYMAGRCISGDFFTQASYRVTGTAVALGYGVGSRIGKES